MHQYLNKITLGDCTELLKQLPDRSVDMIFTDPPYFVLDACKWDIKVSINMQDVYTELARVLKPTGWFFMFGTLEMWHEARQWFKYKFEYVWVKECGLIKMPGAITPLVQHEKIFCFHPIGLKRMGELVFNKEKLRSFGHKTKSVTVSMYSTSKDTSKRINQRSDFLKKTHNALTVYGNNEGYKEGTSVLFFNTVQKSGEKYKFHPTQKPVDLLRYILRGYSNEGDVILDPFGGSGSTAVACIEEKRQFITFEKDETYFAGADKRIKDYQAQQKLF